MPAPLLALTGVGNGAKQDVLDRIQAGVFFTAEHVTRYAQVVVTGQTVVRNLFPPGTSPLGQYVLIGNAPFMVIGGLAGVLVGIAGGLSTAAMAGWRVMFTAAPIGLAFGCAFLTGIVFGYLPARKAAHLEPIEALARE